MDSFFDPLLDRVYIGGTIQYLVAFFFVNASIDLQPSLGIIRK